MKQYATQTELAAITGKDPAWVCRMLKREGAPKATKAGRYRVSEYLAFEESQSASGGEADAETLAGLNKRKRWEEIKRLQVQRAMDELEYDRRRGLLVPRDDVLSLVGRLAQVFVHGLEASCADVSARFPGQPEVVDQYEGLVRRLRERLAEEVDGMGG